MTKKKPAKIKAAPKAARKTLKQPPLIEAVRHVKLDRLCQSIGEARDQAAQIRRSEDGDIQAALDYMLAQSIDVYHHHGTELVLRRGASKLLVRKHKEITADGGPEDEEAIVE